MKKLFILFIFLSCLLINENYSQGKTDTLGNTKIALSTIYNSIFGTSYTSMAQVCQYYTVTINATVDTTAIKVGTNSTLTKNFRTHSGDNYLGKFESGSQPDLWFQSYFTVSSTFQYTVKFINIIR